MNYKELCGRILEISPNVRDVFLVDSQSRLLAFQVREDDMKNVDEGEFAERLEDLSFIAGVCKHYERTYGELEYVNLSYKNRGSTIFPIGADKFLVICVTKEETDIKRLAAKVSEIIQERAQVVEEESARP